MKKSSANSFNEGLNTDLSYLNSTQGMYQDALNATLTTHNGNEFILQTSSGNSTSFVLSENFKGIGNASYDGILYVLSYNELTGEGEIGCFPSPDYATGNMTDDYRPLNNFNGDNPTDYDTAGPFRSARFNFDFGNPCYDVKIQPSYDKSVNIIFTDNRNPVRIINSGFRKLANKRYEVIRRRGIEESNLYNNASFDSTINLIFRVGVIPDLVFEGAVEGSGQLPCGNYTYFFRLSDSDGNETDIVEQSGKIPIFFGTRLPNIRGGRPNERTTKSLSFVLSNIPDGFASVSAYFTYDASETGVDAVSQSFKISREYPIVNGESRIVHTGFENTEQIDINELTVEFVSIEKAKTIEQTQGRLFLGNVTISQSLDEDFENFAKQVYARSVYENPGGSTDFANTSLKFGEFTPFSKVFDSNIEEKQGYANLSEIYEILGYWDEEVYSFGMVFIRPNGSLSPVYPIKATVGSYTGVVDENNNFFDPVSGLNLKGVFRFQGLDTQVNDRNANIRARGVRFRFDEVDPTLYENVKAKSLGYFFVRSERQKICLGEGLAMPCVKHPNVTYNDTESYFENAPGVEEPNLDGAYHAPVMLGHLENMYSLGKVDPSFNDRWTPYLFRMVERPDTQEYIYSRTRMGMWMPDFEMDKGRVGDRLEANDLYLKSVGTQTMNPNDYFKYADATEITGESFTPNQIQQFPNIRIPTSYGFAGINRVSSAGSNINATASATAVDISATSGLQGFTSQIVGSIDQEDVWFIQRVSDYIGLQLEFTQGSYPNYLNEYFASLNAILQDVPNKYLGGSPIARGPIYEGATFPSANNPWQPIENAGIVFRAYSSENPYDISVLKDRFENIQSNLYFPISNRISWQRHEGGVINGVFQVPIQDTGLLCFRGDCYKQISFKRLNFGNPYTLDPTLTFIDPDPTVSLIPGVPARDLIGGVPRPIACFISTLTSNNFNTYLKDEEQFDTLETATYGRERHFFPYSYRNLQLGSVSRVIGARMGIFKLPETSAFNQGYASEPDSKQYIAVRDVPFLETVYDTRVYYSEIQVNNQFINGYRNIKGISYQDYPRHVGEITSLKALNNLLFMVQEGGVSVLGVNDRTIVGEDISGSVFVDQAGVLHPRPQYLSEAHGSRWQGSVVKSSNTIYGIDVSDDKIWMVTPKGIMLISDFKIQSLLKTEFTPYKDAVSLMYDTDVVSIYNPRDRDVHFVLYTPESSFSVIWNEDLQVWVSKSSMIPALGMGMSNFLYTFPAKTLFSGNSCWINSDSSPYCNFYEEQYQFMFEFTMRENVTMQKMLNNLMIVSNGVMPVSLQYTNDNDLVFQNVVLRNNGNILSFNAYYKENHAYIEVAKNSNKRIRDKYHKVKIFYSGTEFTFVQAVMSFFTYSYA